jgi:cbb3-type cytochrome oxidase subunit 3
MDLSTIANLATALAVVVAVIFGIAELRRSRRERRDQAAVEILRSVEAEEIHQAVSRILKLPDDADPELIRGDPQLLHDATLLHFRAEMFGALVFEGVVDLHLLDRMNGGWVRGCWRRLRRWIEAERVAEARVNVGEWWQWLYERLEADPDPGKALGAHVYYRGRCRG